MNKEAFLADLRKRLSGLPADELEERIAFYSEMIDDRMDEGVTEEEAVAGLGPVEPIVDQVVSEISLTKIVREKRNQGRRMKGGEIALLILGFPLWFPLLIAAAAVVFSIYIVLWSAVISLWTADLGLAVCGLSCLISTIPYIEAGNTAGVFFAVGAALVSIGLAILMFFVCLWISKGLIRLTHVVFTRIKKLFVGKEA